MSWFKRNPKIKEPPKRLPHHRSPMTEKLHEEVKKEVKERKTKNRNP